MAEVILMPRLSDTMTEGVIAAWHKKVGDKVNKGDLLAEIETDKATMDLESYQEGTLLHRGSDDGGKLQVNDLLCIIGKEGEDVKELIAKNTAGGLNEAAPAEANQPANEEKPVEKQAATAAVAEKNEAEPTLQKAASINESPSIDISKMEEVVLMPRLSDTMTDGVIAGWSKNVGDKVSKGDVLADIETDKATMELESYKDGILLYQGAKPGEKILVNDLLCIIGKEGMDITAIVAAGKNGGGLPAGNVAEEAETSVQTFTADTPAPLQTTDEEVVNEGRIIASPLAKKIAEEKGLDLRKVKGSGDNGRIIKQDIDNYKPLAQPAQQAPVATAPAKESKPVAPAKAAEVPHPTPASGGGIGQVSYDEVPVSQMRKIIAKRLGESKFSAPHFYLTMSIDMDQAVETRVKLNEMSPVKISFNDLVLKAVAVALKQHPKVNSSWLGDKIRYNHHVNIGVAVAVDEGLLVPVVRFADSKGLSQISAEVKDFAQKAKDKKLQPADWEGSTFTISNLGMFGIDEFTAIINPPDACILAIGGIAKIPVVKNGQVVPGNVMKVTLSCDHRVVDGATGAAFLQTVKALLEEPLRMLV